MYDFFRRKSVSEVEPQFKHVESAGCALLIRKSLAVIRRRDKSASVGHESVVLGTKICRWDRPITVIGRDNPELLRAQACRNIFKSVSRITRRRSRRRSSVTLLIHICEVGHRGELRKTGLRRRSGGGWFAGASAARCHRGWHWQGEPSFPCSSALPGIDTLVESPSATTQPFRLARSRTSHSHLRA